MNNTLLDTVAACSKDLMKFGFSVEEFATLVQENNMTDAEVLAVAKVFEHLKAKKDSSTVDFLLRTSRLPLKVPKTFDNFDFSRITGKNIDKLRNLSTLSALYAHKNLAFIGKPGTGKTHLAQAFGRACCEHGMKAYFIKMTELRDRMTDARRAGRESTLLAALVRPLILSRLVDTFISRISLTMLPVPNPHNTVCVLSWEEARHWQSRSSGYSSS